jgi:hypothetical protein
MNIFKPGEGYVPSYQISPVPFVTGSSVALGEIKQIRFGRVTKNLIIKNEGPATTNVIAISFSENGLKSQNQNFFTISGSESFNQELRTDRVFISGSVGTTNFRIIAGLTEIPNSSFYTLTASNNFDGIG